MRRVLCAGSAALGVLCLLVLLGTGSASAATLCSVNVSPCAGSEFKSGTPLKAVAASPVFKSSVGTVNCETSTLEGETTSDGGEGEPVGAKLSSLTFAGCHLGETSCTVTTPSLPSGTTFNNEGENSTLNLGEGGELTIKCNLLVNCTYTLKEIELQFTGGSFAVATLNEYKLAKLKGFLCPKETIWTAEYEFQIPEALYIVALPAPPIEYTEVEGYGGGCNPGLGSPCNPPSSGSPSGGGGGGAQGAVGCNPATADGVMPRCIVGDLINAATGNLAKEQTDIGPLGGRGPALRVTRSYNSLVAVTATEAGPYGYGWSGPYSSHLTIDEEAETATVHHDNGSAVVFYLIAGNYYPPIWSPATLKKSGANYLYTLPTQEQLEFNGSGQLLKEFDRHGNALTLTYKEGKLETVKDAAGRTLTFAYEGAQVKSVKDPLGHEVKYTYESGKLATVTLPGATEASWKFKYDESRRLTEATDARGYTTKNEYDGSNRAKRQVDPLERERKLEYKETEGVRETTITEPNGSKTFVKFNASGEPTEVTKANGTELAQTTKYEFNASFELLKLTDANNHATTYTYDLQGNQTSEKDANGNEAKWTYNETHDVLTATTPSKETTTITRNGAGDPETIKRPAPESKTQETKFKWAANGDLEEETDPLSRKTKFEYNAYGNLKAETDPAEDKTTWAYDEDGMQVSEVPPRGNEAGKTPSEYETTIERDAQGRPEAIEGPEGHKVKYKYDAAGNLEVVTNANEHATTYVYDKANQRTEAKAANGDVSKTAYNSMGSIKSKTNGNEQTTKYEHNSLEQLTETIDPLERKTVRKYDAAGNLKELQDAAERTTTYTRDAGDRLEKVDYSEEATPDVTFGYNEDGYVTEMKDGTGTSKYVYDQLGRLTEAKNGSEEVVKYKYNLGDEPIEVTYPNGESIVQAYDNAGRLKSVTDWLEGETKFAYNRDSALTSTTFPSTSTNVDEYSYDKADQLEKTAMKKGTETLASIAYARTAAGQLESAIQSGLPGAEELGYAYDERERLKEGAGTAFKYDPANNPTKLGATELEYDAANQLKAAGTTKYAFNSLGERTEAAPETEPATEYGYDQAGHLTSVDRAEEGKVPKIEDAYAYDGNGLRSSQEVSGVTAQLTWDVSGGSPLLLYDGSNYYLYGPDGLPIEQIAGETATYLHHDQQGSTRMLTNSSGEAKGKYTYKPYGEIEEQSGEAKTPLGFAGQYRNESTGLIYLRARAYDPVTAQFLSVDPLVGTTGQPYSYAASDPVNKEDPSGAQPPARPPPMRYGAWQWDPVSGAWRRPVFTWALVQRRVSYPDGTCSICSFYEWVWHGHWDYYVPSRTPEPGPSTIPSPPQGFGPPIISRPQQMPDTYIIPRQPPRVEANPNGSVVPYTRPPIIEVNPGSPPER